MPLLEMVTPTAIAAGSDFEVSLRLSEATPGEQVTLKLKQTRGTEPLLIPEPRSVAVTGDGRAAATFSGLRFDNPGWCVLLARAVDANELYLGSDSDIIRVL